MASQHINKIKIKNFKCFKNLDIPSFKKVNLVGGKNNVGKTSLLEAIELLSSSKKTLSLIEQIRNMLARRQVLTRNQTFIEIDFMHDDSPCMLIESSIRRCEVRFEERAEGAYQEGLFEENLDEVQGDLYLNISVNGKEKTIPANIFLRNRNNLMFRRSIDDNTNNINYIKSSKTDEHSISLLYGALIDLNKEDFLNSSLSIFDENLIAIKQRATERGVILKIQKKHRKQPVLLSSLGDGVNRYIAILCAIWASENGILFIDEIENGIHYSNYRKLWDIIFKASIEANCQIFVTSHSKECIEAFNSYQIDTPSNQGLYFELFRRKKDNIIKATSRDAEQLNYALKHGGKIRGE